MKLGICIPSRLGSHRIDLTRERKKLSSRTREVGGVTGFECRRGCLKLTIGQLDGGRVWINSRKDAPISHIRMGDQRDRFPVETDRSKRDCVNIQRHVVWEFLKRESLGRSTDPMKVWAMDIWSREREREKRFRLSKL